MNQTGRLSVRVYASKAELPLEGSTVVVTQAGKTGKYNLLSVQVTDSSGQIRPVEIQIPETDESTSPGNGTPAVFSLCNVWAEHPGYAMLEVDGIQVFPEIETVQNMELIPLEEGETSLQQRDVRQVTEQKL